tara:strand:+ start:716 stop:916 length:201 start_codon:yes stop_codon:yes gene_type:complete
MARKRKQLTQKDLQIDPEDGIQQDVGMLPQVPPQSSGADEATDEMLKGLENADQLIRIARLAGGEH